MAPESKLKAKEAIIRWLETSGLKSYDLSVNNVMVRHENNELDIQLIDFADASKTIEDCLSDIKNWSWYLEVGKARFTFASELNKTPL